MVELEGDSRGFLVLVVVGEEEEIVEEEGAGWVGVSQHVHRDQVNDLTPLTLSHNIYLSLLE